MLDGVGSRSSCPISARFLQCVLIIEINWRIRYFSPCFFFCFPLERCLAVCSVAIEHNSATRWPGPFNLSLHSTLIWICMKKGARQWQMNGWDSSSAQIIAFIMIFPITLTSGGFLSFCAGYLFGPFHSGRSLDVQLFLTRRTLSWPSWVKLCCNVRVYWLSKSDSPLEGGCGSHQNTSVCVVSGFGVIWTRTFQSIFFLRLFYFSLYVFFLSSSR